MNLHLIQKTLVNSSLRYSKIVQNGQMVYGVDNLFCIYVLPFHLTHMVHILSEYRTKNRIKIAGSKYEDTMVKMVGWNGKVQMSSFCICCTMSMPCSCHHSFFLFLPCLCASQDSFNWEWTKANSNKLKKNVHQFAIIRAFFS